jgi:hypothetical protein
VSSPTPKLNHTQKCSMLTSEGGRCDPAARCHRSRTRAQGDQRREGSSFKSPFRPGVNRLLGKIAYCQKGGG